MPQNIKHKKVMTALLNTNFWRKFARIDITKTKESFTIDPSYQC